jgi:hypothetical protein
MGKKSNKQLRRDNGYNYNTDDISRLREMYVVRDTDRDEKTERNRRKYRDRQDKK